MALPKLLKEPLLHFLLAGGAVFAAYMLAAGDGWNNGRITVTSAKISQMTEVFAKTWHRPPSADELKAMIDDYVKEEIYVRQALALGLDQDDTVIRRRLRQKMEFLANSEAESLVPADAELQAFLNAHPRGFEIEPQIALEQIFLRSGADAADMLAMLKSKPDADASTLGDPTMLPRSLPSSGISVIAEIYGPEVSEAARKAPQGRWAGPVQSGYGYHLIRVREHQPGRVPALASIREAVGAEWMQAKRREAEERRLAEWLKRFEVVIETPVQTAGNRP